MTPRTVGAALEAARQALSSLTETPGPDAQLLLAEVLGVDRAWVLAHPEAPLADAQVHAFQHGVDRCLSGEALPYVLGSWEFFGRRFRLTPRVLIPRPETELLVENALAYLSANPERRRVADVGTGSGCIAVTLAAEVGGARLVATDVSFEALLVARSNALWHGVAERVEFVQSDLLYPLAGVFDLVCANLPYIPTQTLAGLDVGRREPRLALDGGEDGLSLVRRLLRMLAGSLAQGGQALVEIEAGQGDAAREAAHAALPDAKLSLRADLTGRDRLLVLDRVSGSR